MSLNHWLSMIGIVDISKGECLQISTTFEFIDTALSIMFADVFVCVCILKVSPDEH